VRAYARFLVAMAGAAVAGSLEENCGAAFKGRDYATARYGTRPLQRLPHANSLKTLA
jgi:hypothetical protein